MSDMVVRLLTKVFINRGVAMSIFNGFGALGRGSHPHDILTLKVRSDLHLARKAYHILGVLIITGLYQVLSREQSIVALGMALGLLAGCDILRLRSPRMNKVVFGWFKVFLRQEEAQRVSGMTYLLTGSFLVVLLFPKEVVTLAFLFLAFGDPIASAVGVVFGKDKIVGNKSLQGTVAGFVVCTLIAALYFAHNSIMADRIILVSVLAGMAGAVSELMPIGKIDDNFTIPGLSAGFLWGMFWFFGGFN